VRDVILKPRDEVKDLPAAWSDVGRLIIFHFSFLNFHFSMDEPTELPKFAKTPSHRRHVSGRFFAALRMT
jgi:hypothetical protein